MGITANQYAERIYAEHPIALWTLDEEAYYLSLIDDNSRSFSSWTLTGGCTYSDTPTIPDTPSPFLSSSPYSSLIKNTASAGTIQAVSAGLFSISDISGETNTFCVNFFMYQKPDYINWFKVGYQYVDGDSVTQTVLSDQIAPPESASWINFNNTYLMPDVLIGDIKLVIQISFANSSDGDASSRTVIVHGLSVGQNSETTCFVSSGSTPISIPDDAGIVGMTGIPADQYGVVANNGYYLVRNNSLLAHNDGYPIIYGTNNSTKIYPSNVNLPSLIFPGNGMLNEAGRNKQYTFEMWMKLDPSTSSAKKILGPLGSNDGIYVREGFLTLVIGNEIGSHCVSEWYRPMLLHILFKDSNVVVLVNGEEVINIKFDRKTIDLPNTKDWWGIYSYSSISVFQVDSISIYPYIMSTLVAKRRFVYGQGTPSAQTLDNGFQGTPTVIDFTTAEYSSNIIYPDIARWDAGYFNNLIATKDYLSTPNYSLPTLQIEGLADHAEWFRDNYTVNTLEYPPGSHPNFITFRPNIDYDGDGNPTAWNPDGIKYTGQTYLNFPTLNILNETLAAVYGIFEVEQNISEPRTLISFANTTNQTFDITVVENTIRYSINGRELTEARQTFNIGTECLVGINFETFGLTFGYEVSRFFSSPSSIQMYVGGNGINTFEGKIYLVGFCNESNYSYISNIFNSYGVTNPLDYELALDRFASYTLIPEFQYGQLYLDISVASEWEEYFPLKKFSSPVKKANGAFGDDLDMIQLNLGYVSVESNAAWLYRELKNEFSSQTYQDLANSVYSNYLGLRRRNTAGGTINVSESSLQSYVTFQKLSDGANKHISEFVYKKNLQDTLVIDADAENTESIPDKAYKTAFSFKDNVIVYPPKSQNFEDYAMVVHFSINQRSVLKNPFKIKSFELASKNFNYNSLTGDSAQRNYIGTKFGQKIYPEIDSAGTIDYKSKNPYFIYKASTPYIYTTKKSGIKIANQTAVVDPMDSDQYRISIPINSNGAFDFSVGAINFNLISNVIDAEIRDQLMDIKHKDGIISLILEKDASGIRIKAYNKTTSYPPQYTEAAGIMFYQNGKYVSVPVIKNNEWNSIGISFATPLDFSQFIDGKISIYGGATFNNISYYLSDGLGIKNDLTVRTWEEVLNNGGTTRVWQYWADGTWQTVYVIGQKLSYVSTPSNIYASYTGTNRNIVDDNFGLSLNQKESVMLTDVSWNTFTQKPA